jgi:hypothetical protein
LFYCRHLPHMQPKTFSLEVCKSWSFVATFFCRALDHDKPNGVRFVSVFCATDWSRRKHRFRFQHILKNWYDFCTHVYLAFSGLLNLIAKLVCNFLY